MAWIKIGERDIINADAIKTIAIQQFRDGSYYVRFSLNDDDSIISKGFEQFKECLEMLNRIWSAVADNLSIDVS